MSDILDALRKAELQREHARGPGLSTQQRYAVAPPAHPERWLWGAAAAFVLGISSAWLLSAYGGRGDVAEAAPGRFVPAPAVPALAPGGTIVRPALRSPGPRRQPDGVVSATPSGLPEGTAAIAEDVPLGAADGAPEAAAPVEVPPVPASAVPPPQEDAAGTVQDDAADAAPVRQELAMIRDPFAPLPRSRLVQQRSEHGMRETAPGPVAEDDPVPLLRTLPYRFQSMVPKLVINAQAYARAAEERFVIINMKKYGEGERTAEGILIEAIREQDIVLSYQGQQFRLQR